MAPSQYGHFLGRSSVFCLTSGSFSTTIDMTSSLKIGFEHHYLTRSSSLFQFRLKPTTLVTESFQIDREILFTASSHNHRRVDRCLLRVRLLLNPVKWLVLCRSLVLFGEGWISHRHFTCGVGGVSALI